MTPMFLDVWMATLRWFVTKLRTWRVERAAIVLAEHCLRGGAAIARDRDGEQARRTLASVTRQLASVSSAREWFIADLRELKRAKSCHLCARRVLSVAATSITSMNSAGFKSSAACRAEINLATFTRLLCGSTTTRL